MNILETFVFLISAYLNSQFSLSCYHGVMFFFFFEMMNELVFCVAGLSFASSPASAGIVSSDKVYVSLVFLPCLGAILPFLVGLFPADSCMTRLFFKDNDNLGTKTEYEKLQLKKAKEEGKLRFFKSIQVLSVAVTGTVIVVLRFITPFINNPGRVILCFVTILFYLIYWPFVLQQGGLSVNANPEQDALTMGVGLAIGILLRLLWLVIGRGVDILVYPKTGYFAFTAALGLYVLMHFAFLIIYYVDDYRQFVKNYLPSLRLQSLSESGEQAVQLFQSRLAQRQNTMSVTSFEQLKAGEDEDDAIYLLDGDSDLLEYKGLTFDQIESIRNGELTTENSGTVEQAKQHLERFSKPSTKTDDSDDTEVFDGPLDKLRVFIFKFFHDSRSAIMALGLANNLSLLIFTICSPYSMGRWVGASLPVFIFAFIICSLLLYVVLAVLRIGTEPFPKLRPIVVGLLNICIVVFLTTATWSSSTLLPDDTNKEMIEIPAAYLLLSNILLLIFLLMTIIVLLDFQLMWYDIVKKKANLAWISIGFGVGHILFAVFSVLAAYTVVYAEEKQPQFKNAYWSVMLLISLCSTLPTIFIKLDSYSFGKSKIALDSSEYDKSKRMGVENDSEDIGCKRFNLAFVLVVAAALTILIAVLLFALKPSVERTLNPAASSNSTYDSNNSLVFMTWNIQSGIDVKGNRFYTTIADTVADTNADVIVFVESGTNRILNAHDDLMKYIADTLKYETYYGAVPTTGTVGVSILSKFPFINTQTLYIKVSENEDQINALLTKIVVGGSEWNVVAVQLNDSEEDRLKAIEVIAAKVKEMKGELDSELARTVILGDFNFVPSENSSAYTNLTSFVHDSWVTHQVTLELEDPSINKTNQTYLGYTFPSLNLGYRYDHIYLSNDLNSLLVDAVVVLPEKKVADHLPYFVRVAYNQTAEEQ